MNVWSRYETKLWMSGLVGFAVRWIFRLTWRRIEFIPPGEKLWRALHKVDQVYREPRRAGRPKPSFFRDKWGLSCDLARFSTAERSRIGHAEKPHPAEAGLVEFSVGNVREIGSDVRHEPVRKPRRNYAHAQFTSTPSTPARSKLADKSTYHVPQRFV